MKSVIGCDFVINKTRRAVVCEKIVYPTRGNADNEVIRVI